MRSYTYHRASYVEGETCASKGRERCLPCLSEPAKQGSFYRTRDGHRFLVTHFEHDRRNGMYAVATMLSIEGGLLHDREHAFGMHGEFMWPLNNSSPSDLVEEVGKL